MNKLVHNTIKYLIRLLFGGWLFSLSIVAIYAAYTPAPNIYLFGTGNSGTNGHIAFSYSPTLSWSAPIAPTKLDSSYNFHGNVWVDSIGWTTFDHGVVGSEVKINDSTCVTDVARSACTLTGFLWSKNVGWIRFSGNNGYPDAEFHKPSLTLSGLVWNNQVGWFDISGIKLILGPIYPNINGGTDLSGGNYAFATTGSMDLGLSIPASINNLLASLPPITIEICISGGGYCRVYTFDAVTGKFPSIDLSLAIDYDYTITDPFGSRTTGIFHVYAGTIISNGGSVMSGSYNGGQGLLKKYCFDNPLDTVLCPDTLPSTSFVTGELKNGDIVGPRYANNQDSYIANIRLRDAYGNPIKSVVGVKDVTVTTQINSSLDFISTSKMYQYGGILALLGLWDAFTIDLFGANAPVIGGALYTFTRPYIPTGESIKIRAYAPTTAGNTTIPNNNDLSLSAVTVTVTKSNPYNNVGEGAYTITPLVKTTNLPFLPLARITSISGFENIQMGRIGSFTGRVDVTDTLGSIDAGSAFAIHGLTIGDGVSLTTSSFQDFTTVAGDECNAFTDVDGASTPGYVGYCTRLSNILSSPASVITFPFSTSRDHVFEAIPRRIVEIELEQGYKYDSIIRYMIGGKEIVYPSLFSETVSTDDKIFGNAVKILGQKSGKNIFQSISNTDQTTIDGLSRSEYINTIRKNIGLLIRNVTFTSDTYSGSDLKVYKKDILLNPTLELLTHGKRTIVAFGDITITDDLINPNDTDTLAIIALKNESGTGGNIFIKSNVKRIDASLIAQGTIFSGEKAGSTRYYTQEPDATNILVNQLYIFGSVVSLNTIGGASLELGSRCPSNDVSCDNTNALIYDFEHLRYYRGGVSEAATLAHDAALLNSPDKESSLIIEFNEKLLLNPPPGLQLEQ